MNKILGSLLAATIVTGGLLANADDAWAKPKVKVKPAPRASATATTNINDCAKVDAAQRDKCISMSRPVRGAELYAKWAPAAGAAPAATGAAAKVKAAAGAAAGAAAATSAATQAKAAQPGAGTTSIDDCAKVDPAARDACISRSKPISGADLYKKFKQ